MTRAEIIAEAGRRIRDTSSAFKTAVFDSLFDMVLAEMASKGAITALNSKNSAVVFVASQRSYTTLALSGLSTPNYPLEIIRLRAWAWGLPGGIIEKKSDAAFALQRARDGDTAGQPRIWRYSPNEQAVEVHPPPNSASAAATIDVEYLKPPTLIADGTHITEVHFEDIPTIIAGLKVYAGEHQSDIAADRDSMRQKDLAIWSAGLAAMVARNARRPLTDRQRMAQSRAA